MEQNLEVWRTQTREALAADYSAREADAVAAALLRHLTGYSRMEQALRKKEPLSETQATALLSMVERLIRMEPLQYVMGETEFFGHRFLVQPGVLIPRPETEELVAWVAADRKELSSAMAVSKCPFRMLDVGTGSGCLAISLKLLFPQANVVALDVSAPALEVAKQNAALHQVTVQWLRADFLSGQVGAADTNTDTEGINEAPFEVIVSNPPYVSCAQQLAMSPNVLDYEPHGALFPEGDDVLIFYRRLADFSRQKLVAGGALYVEINEDYPDETAAIFREAGLKDVELRRDIRDKWRMCKAVRT